MLAINITLSSIFFLSTVTIQLDKDLKSKSKRNDVYYKIKEVKKRVKKIPELDPIKDMRLPSNDIKPLQENIKSLKEQLSDIKDVDITSDDYKNFVNKIQLQQKERTLHQQVKHAEELALTDQLKIMKRVLRRLEYIDDKNVVQMKGKVACEIDASDELLLTELIFDKYIILI